MSNDGFALPELLLFPTLTSATENALNTWKQPALQSLWLFAFSCEPVAHTSLLLNLIYAQYTREDLFCVQGETLHVLCRRDEVARRRVAISLMLPKRNNLHVERVTLIRSRNL